MAINFIWHDSNILSEGEKTNLEEDVKYYLEDWGDSYIDFCHPSTLVMNLNIDGPLNEKLVGNIKCSCGTPYLIITGSRDGSSITYEKV